MRDGMEELEVQIEGDPGEAEKLADAFNRYLGLRIGTRPVPHATLPRFELKARRIVDLRRTGRPVVPDVWWYVV